MKHSDIHVARSALKACMAAIVVASLCWGSQAHAGGGGYAPAAPAPSESAASAPSAPAFKNFGDEGKEGDRPNDGVHFIAAWTAMAEICQQEYPQLVGMLKGFWAKKLGENGEATLAQIQSTQRYKDKYNHSMGVLLKKRDEVIQQCELLFRGGAH